MRNALFTSLLLLAACGAHDPETVMQTIQGHQSPNDNGGVRIDPSTYSNRDLVAVDLHNKQFHILSREQAVEKFPCNSCHKVPLPQMKHDGKNGKPRAHWGLVLKHAPPETMTCATCHLEGDLNKLTTLTAKPVDWNASYRVCAQCHSTQAADWAAGAHGKRLGGWAPPRVSKTCAECHNPHAPAWDPRYPARAAKREDKPGHE